MSPVIRIPDELYEALDQRAKQSAKPFQTPVDVIWSLLDQSSEEPMERTHSYQSFPARQHSPYRPTVEEWKEHFEIVLGYREGKTNIGTPEWSENIHEKLCNGEIAFGIKGTNAAEAILQVIKENTPDKYNNALMGLKATILDGRDKGEPLKKLTKMYNRVSGELLDDDI